MFRKAILTAKIAENLFGFQGLIQTSLG